MEKLEKTLIELFEAAFEDGEVGNELREKNLAKGYASEALYAFSKVVEEILGDKEPDETMQFLDNGATITRMHPVNKRLEAQRQRARELGLLIGGKQ